jgi:hypothetical protein
MSRALQRDRLEAELETVARLIKETPVTRAFSRASLESREREIKAALAELPRSEGTNAEVVLSFEGEPVAGAEGIDARFSADALLNFQKLVTAVAARKSRGELSGSGSFPDANAARLHVSNVVHGSFGFQLQELERQLIGATPLAEAVERSLTVLEAARQGGDTFAEVIAKEGPRIQDAALGFLDVLRRHHAAVRLVSDHADVRFDAVAVPLAVEAIKSVEVEEKEEKIPGRFGGFLLGSKRFEHTPEGADKPIYGTVDESVDWRQLHACIDRDCTILVRVTRTLVAGQEKRRPGYVLIGIEP